MKQCRVCGASVADHENVCSYCGAEVVSENKGSAVSPQQENSGEDMLKYAEFTDKEAYYRMAVCKLKGTGVRKDVAEAAKMLEYLAKRGHFDAMFTLAETYIDGGGDDNIDKALKWLKIAAENGHEPSRIKLRMLGVNPELSSAADASAKTSDSNGDLSRLAKEALRNVVTVTTDRKTGAGFVIDGGYVITNAHVVGQESKIITARFDSETDGNAYGLERVVVADKLDIAVLKFVDAEKAGLRNRKGLKLRCAPQVGYGEDVYTIGNPCDCGLSVSRGVVSCPNRLGMRYPREVKNIIQTDISTYPGNSGGPLLDMDNRVVGMVTFKPGDSDRGISMTIPAAYIAALLKEIGVLPLDEQSVGKTGADVPETATAANIVQKAPAEAPGTEADGHAIRDYDKSKFEINGTELVRYRGNDAEVVIPDGVTAIGMEAFCGCSGLESIIIPEHVTDIEEDAFSGCSGLERISVAEGNGKYYSKNNCIIEKGMRKLVLGCKNSVIPDCVTAIGMEAFSGCSGLESIIIPEHVTSIETGAFYDCVGLKDIIISDNVTAIKHLAFRGCVGLKSIIIPHSVRRIDNSAFRLCCDLTVYCEAESKPEGWAKDWRGSCCKVVWGYKGK